MPEMMKNRPLKICYNCGHWLYQYKGLCQRLGQGVGKFWFCAEWTAAPAKKNSGQAATPEKPA